MNYSTIWHSSIPIIGHSEFFIWFFILEISLWCQNTHTVLVCNNWTCLVYFWYGKGMSFLVYCYSICLCLLDSFKKFYFSTRMYCDWSKETMIIVSAYKVIASSIINTHYLLKWCDTMFWIFMVQWTANNYNEVSWPRGNWSEYGSPPK